MSWSIRWVTVRILVEEDPDKAAVRPLHRVDLTSSRPDEAGHGIEGMSSGVIENESVEMVRETVSSIGGAPSSKASSSK